MDRLSVEALAQQVERLERENCRLGRRTRLLERAGLALATVGAVACLVGGSRRDEVPQAVEARKFVLKDEGGRERAVLAHDKDGSPYLRFYDRAGKVRLRMALERSFEDDPSEAAVVSTCDVAGHDRVKMMVSEVGVPELKFFDEDRFPRLDILVDDEHDAVRLELGDKRPATQFSLNGFADGSVGMHFGGLGPKDSLSLYNGDGEASLTIRDRQEKERIVLKSEQDGSASIKIFDKDGRPLFQGPKP